MCVGLFAGGGFSGGGAVAAATAILRKSGRGHFPAFLSRATHPCRMQVYLCRYCEAGEVVCGMEVDMGYAT